MKRRLILIASMILLLTVSLSLFLGCNENDAEKQIPVYKGMTVSSAGETSAASYNSDPNVPDGGGVAPAAGEYAGDFAGRNGIIDKKEPFKGSGETIEQKLAASFEEVESTEMIYYAKVREDIYIHILIDNPDGFGIVSVTFNGKTYTSDMFEEGSDTENITLKYDVGTASGVEEYTLDGIKYQDGKEEKDVTLEGEKTVKVGLRRVGQVSAAASGVAIESNSLSFNATVADPDGLLDFSDGTVQVVLYDGTDILATRELALGVTAVSFEGLKTDTLYQYAIVGYYNDLSGDGFQMNVLYTDAFYTDAVVLFDDVTVFRDGISFDFLWNADRQGETLTALKLYQGEALVEALSVTDPEIDGLLCNNTYRLVAEYQNGERVESIELLFTTRSKATPMISLTALTTTQSSVDFDISEFDIDEVGALTRIELVHANGTTFARSLTQRSFTGLLSGNPYTVRIIYVYDLNDGKGAQTAVRELVFTTQARATPELVLTAPTRTKDSVGFTIDETDVDSVGMVAKIELVHANGTVTASSLTQRSFTGLLSGNPYTVKVTYVYNLKDGAGDRTVVKELAIATDAKATPTLAITDPNPTQTSIGFAVEETDIDNVGAVTRIELIHASGTTVAQNTAQRTFTDLIPSTVYTIQITYVYDLNDGAGARTLVRSLSVFTSEKKSIDLTGYAIVTGAELTEYGQQYVLDVAQALGTLTGLDITVKRDTVGTAIQNGSLEILVGLTRREESFETYNDIEGEGFAIRVFERKIAIVGTTPYLTAVALNWFEQNYFNDKCISGSKLSLLEENITSNITVLPLAEGNTTFTVVYETGKDSLDAPYQFADKVRDALLERTGLTVPFVTVGGTAVAREVLVGNMSRSDVKAEMSKLEADEYAITVRDGKIYLVAWSDDVLPSAYALFEEMLLASAVTDGNGNVTYKIPNDCTFVRTHESDWITDFPKPEFAGLYPEAAVDVNGGALQYIYSGEGATYSAFMTYCLALRRAGYTPLEEKDVQWEGSYFRTFVHNEKGISLHVAYMAFTHAEEQGVSGLVRSIRIVSGSLDQGGRLVDEKHFRPQIEGEDYVKRMDSQITANVIDYSAENNWGFGQVITLADGSFILIDGGRNYGGAGEVNNLWNILREMHKRAHGSYPSAAKPIHIRAWIITHEHGDHHNLIQNFIKKYGANTALKFDYLLANFGSMTQLREAGGTFTLRNNMKTYQQTVRNGFEFVEVNTGQVLYFANCKVEILTTVDDKYPWRCNEQNNASLIVRTTLYESDGTNSHQVSSLWLGDAEVQQSQVARAMYGRFLASDQVQVAHHGNNGGSDKHLYEMVGNCSVIWYPNVTSHKISNQSALDRALKDNWACSFSAAFKNPNCKLMIFNGSDISGCAAWNVTLTITATGTLYDQLYDAVTGEHIDAKGSLWPAVDVQAYRQAVGK